MASVSGAILAVCSCTVLPLFAGIYKKGAGLGPAVTFLFSGPAINILAITLTTRKMGWELGLARAIGAVVFSIVIGLLMAFIFRKEEAANNDDDGMFAGEEGRPVGHLLAFFGTLVAILLFGTAAIPFWSKIAIIFALLSFLAVVLTRWYDGDEVKEWLVETWRFVKLIFPVLLVGVFVAGVLKAVIPQHWIETSVGGN
ncbi:uncharacterized membrane protein YraQ (UPF0718 family) [Desulfohalotomaculum tongense]|nr:uncharacterized membrane protein YraQ (UPF0718 family) [Desulforadius tongensis]